MTKPEAIELFDGAIQKIEDELNSLDEEYFEFDSGCGFAYRQCLSLLREYGRQREAKDMGIKALEREDILDKIRAEIEQITDTMGVSYNQYVSKIDVLQIIDKYKEESEE